MTRKVLPQRRKTVLARAAFQVERRRVELEVYALTDGKIAAGPFAGMEFVSKGSWGSLSPLLAGCYEAELFPAIESFIIEQPKRVVVVGAAEGYYAVGFARRLPSSQVVAFDIDANAQSVCVDLAKRNNVAERLTVRGECGWEELEKLAGPGCLAIIDCEGCELPLLDPAKVPSLSSTMMLVELHDFVDPSIRSKLERRFASSHTIEIIRSGERDPEGVAAVASLSFTDKKLAVDEMRPTRPHPMEWAVLKPR
jgi:threonine dehydrogenase-like Zn-dependent dehydrogenase